MFRDGAGDLLQKPNSCYIQQTEFDIFAQLNSFLPL